MAHELQKSSDMAYVGDIPWHGLGNQLAPKQPIEVWARQAGMDFEILEAPVRFVTVTEHSGSLGAIHSYAENKVLYRSDTKAPLSVVSNRYQTVQPREVLEFYRDLTQVSGYELETAGVLKGGKKFWALAKTGKSAAIKGNDVMHGYVLLATSCDGTLATTATVTSIRVVCNNTLAIALKNGTGLIKVPHSTLFDPRAVKSDLGIAVGSWDNFIYEMKLLSERKVKSNEAMAYMLRVFAEQPVPGGNGLPNERAITKVLAMFNGQGKGAELASSKGTAFGLINAVTEFVDHERKAKNEDFRFDSSQFGVGAAIKQRALEQAMLLAA
jgi:phage/plasmid-like protein (TIGR03299 family)